MEASRLPEFTAEFTKRQPLRFRSRKKEFDVSRATAYLEKQSL
jgi:hypothetical protein